MFQLAATAYRPHIRFPMRRKLRKAFEERRRRRWRASWHCATSANQFAL